MTEYGTHLEDERWVSSSLLTVIRRAYPTFVRTVNAGGYVSERIELDTLGRAYTLVEIALANGTRKNVLLYSTDSGRSWRLVTLPFGGKPRFFDGRDNGTAALEQYAGWNMRDVPPLVAVWKPVRDWPGGRASISELYVLRPVFKGTRLVLPEPTLVSRRFIGMSYAAGGASFAASNAGTSWLVWITVARDDENGTPTYVCTFNEETRTVSDRRRIAYARPPNDDHDTPGIVRDGDGYLHVLTGGHNTAFQYVRSVSPLDAKEWTSPQPALNGGYWLPGMAWPGRARQTYLSLACLPDNSLVVVSRQRRANVDHDVRISSYGALCCQRRAPDGTWSGAQRLIFCSNYPGYAQFHQKLTVDRLGRLYLSLSYFNPHEWPKSKREANRYHHRMLLISKDGGTTWDFARTADFVEGMAQATEPADTESTAAPPVTTD